jgi:ankyrin repeat protein
MEQAVDELITACVAGDLPAVRRILGRDPALATAANMFGATPAHAAHYSGHSEIADLLLTQYARLDGFLAAELGLTRELRDQLRNDPALPRKRNAAGSTALHGACYWGSLEATALLLDHGAEINIPTSDSFLQIHPLGCAVATANVPNPSDEELVVLRLVNLLLDKGAEVNARRRDGMTALHSAAYRGHVKVIQRLLDAGADRTVRAHGTGTHNGESAEDTALAQGQTAAAELLRNS